MNYDKKRFIMKMLLYVYSIRILDQKGGEKMIGGILWLLLFSVVALAGIVITLMYGKVFDNDDDE